MFLHIAMIVIALFIAFIAVVLIIASTKPGSFQVRRETTIQAAPEKIFPSINDFHNWAAWSPFEKLDPAMKKTYTGQPSGKGAVYEWDGNSKAGKGRMEILESAPGKITIKLDFIKPFEGHNTAEFTMLPKGSLTEITWSMHGPCPFLAKIMHVFVSMDRMIGRSFEEGLANLKAIAEK
jgi:hypothetical protein